MFEVRRFGACCVVCVVSRLRCAVYVVRVPFVVCCLVWGVCCALCVVHGVLVEVCLVLFTVCGSLCVLCCVLFAAWY